MPKAPSLQKADIRAALVDLDALAHAEYNASLEEILLSRDANAPLRLERLVGVALKRRFARPAGAPSYSATDALRSWPWPDGSDSLEVVDDNATRDEVALLKKLAMPGPWNENKPLDGTAEDEVPVPWGRFKDDVEHERGLFKIIALYAIDKFNNKERRTLREYLDAPESRRFEAGLDLATLLFDAGVASPLAAALSVPTLAVGVALVGMQYGYRVLADPNANRVGDGQS